MSTVQTAATPAKENPFAVASTPKRQDIKTLLQGEAFREQVRRVLPSHMKPDRMIRVALTTLTTTPKLLNCTQESLFAALLKCSQYGLEPDGRHAHLIPYGDTCQLIFDYKGLVALVRRSGDVSDIMADVVYEADEFEVERGNNARLMHKPNLKAQDRGPIYAIYSFVRLKDGTPSFEVMRTDEVEAIKERSQGYQAAKKYNKQSPWDTDWAEMAKKTVFRRHTKWLPISAELKEAVNADDDTLADDRFKNAKPAKVVAPEFSMPALTEPRPEPEQQASQQEPAQTETQTPEPQPVQQSQQAQQAQPTTPTPAPVLGEKKPRKDVSARQIAYDTMKELMAKDGLDEATVTEYLVMTGGIPKGSTIAKCPSDLIASFVMDWATIVEGIQLTRE